MLRFAERFAVTPAREERIHMFNRFRQFIFLVTALLATGTVMAQDTITINLASTNTAVPTGSIKLVEQDMGFTTVTKQLNVNARSTTPPADKTGQYMFFMVYDKYEGTPGTVKDLYVTVRYFDSGTDTFQLEYDATSGDPATDDPDADIHRVAGTAGNLDKVFKTDSGKWLTHIFHLNDVYFGHRMEGGTDFRIDDNGDGPETIAGVIVNKTNPVKLNIPQVSTPPTLDGKLDEPFWKTTDNEVKLCDGSQDVIRPTSWKNTDDYCGDFHYAWDNVGLYVAVDVVDDVPRDNTRGCGEEWNGDGFEVFWGFDQANPGRKTQIDGQDFHWYIAAAPEGTPVTWAYETVGGTVAKPNGDCSTGDNVIITDRTDGKIGYIMEVRMPWSLWKSTKDVAHDPPKAGQFIGFTMFGNDGDGDPGSQDKALSWAGIPGPSGNPSAWLTIQLGGLPVACTPGNVNADTGADGKPKVDVNDAILILKAAVGLSPLTADQQKAANVNGDKNADNTPKIDVNDAILVLKAAVGLTTLPAACA
jgi:hypothetical protein